MAKAIMIQGTASNVGKSVIATGLCRIFANEGYRVAPFKAQNISNISVTTKDGFEMSKAQAIQAQACFKEPDPRMNPILMKPSVKQVTGYSSQIILNGKPLDYITPADFYAMKPQLINDIRTAFESLAAENDIIVIEGAGSCAEINLKASDVVNMRVAVLAKAPVLLVGDIDKGGVFASLYGSVMLQSEEERRYIKATIINKFRGDPKYLEPAPKMLEDLIHLPNAGVLPYVQIDIEPEDILSQGDNASQKNDFEGLASHLKKYLNMELIHRILEEGITF